MITINVR